MSRLIIMRHAEAVAAVPGGDDFHRDLTARGRDAAAHAAQPIQQAAGMPQLLLHSPAVRTTETARLVAAALGDGAPRLLPVPAIYRAGGRALLQLLEPPGHAALCLLLIGHNPGVSELLRLLDPAAASERHWLAPAEFAVLEQ